MLWKGCGRGLGGMCTGLDDRSAHSIGEGRGSGKWDAGKVLGLSDGVRRG